MMALYQKQVRDIVELTEEGVAQIQQHKNSYSETTRPVASHERFWNAWSMGNLWVGIIVSIAVYQVASGLIVAGMTWYQALFTIVLGHTLVMAFAVILGHFGTKYGLNFPMLCKMAFGTRGVIVPTLVRGIIGCFWFGVQSWIGGQAVNAILSAIIPGWSSLEFTGFFISFLLFWALNVYIAGNGSRAVKALQDYSAPILIVLSFIVIGWALSAADWNLAVLMSDPSLHGKPDSNFWALFFPALSAMIAFDAGIAMSMPDFTRYCKSQKSQMLGQIISAPLTIGFISFVGICGTAGAAIVFQEAIWEPAILVSKFDNPLIVVIFSLFLMVAVLTTNVAGNLVPPVNVIATFFKKLTIKKASIIAAVLALFAQPWRVLASPEALIFDVLGFLGALLGPISGILVVSYLFAHHTKVDLVDIYREDGGKYAYTKGWNIPIFVILLISILFVLLGMIFPSFRIIYDNAFVIGSIGAGLIYYLYLLFAKQSAPTNAEVSGHPTSGH